MTHRPSEGPSAQGSQVMVKALRTAGLSHSTQAIDRTQQAMGTFENEDCIVGYLYEPECNSDEIPDSSESDSDTATDTSEDSGEELMIATNG